MTRINIVSASLLANTIKILADLWIGSIKNAKWGLSSTQSLLVYAALTLLFGLTYCFGGYLIPLISVSNTEYFHEKLCSSLAHSRLAWFDEQNNFKVASRLNRVTIAAMQDNAELFVLNGRIQNVFAYLIVFVATVLLVGKSSPAFFILAGAVLVS